MTTSGDNPFSAYSTLHERIDARNYEGMRIQHRWYVMSHAAVLRPCVEEGVLFVLGG